MKRAVSSDEVMEE